MSPSSFLATVATSFESQALTYRLYQYRLLHFCVIISWLTDCTSCITKTLLLFQISWEDDFFESFEETPLFAAILTYLGYAILVIIGQIRDLLRAYGIESDKSCTEPKQEVISYLFILFFFVIYGIWILFESMLNDTELV